MDIGDSIEKRRDLLPSLVFGVLVAVPVFLFARPLSPSAAASALWALYTGAIGALILRSGRVARWRALFFATVALGFLVRFKAELFLATGRLFLSESPQEVPYCHIAMASTALGTLYQQYLAWMSGSWKAWGPLSLGALWLLATLALGQAWCSWVCFYGGIDDALSRLLPRPLLRWRSVPGRLRDFPAALLVFLLLVSLSSMLPVFCLWLCPLKMTTAFLDPDGATRRLQLALMLCAGLVFLVGLPLLTGKRTFCGLLCPFGAWQAFFGRLNPFRVSVAPEACTACGACVDACPTFSLARREGAPPEVLPYCCRCGSCMDACAASGIGYTVFGRALRGRGSGWASLLDARAVFVFCALVVGGTVGALFVPAAVRSLFSLVFAGGVR
jgi:NAD-dependent dihydropyrimidine dehydrogenase PreA subunit